MTIAVLKAVDFEGAEEEDNAEPIGAHPIGAHFNRVCTEIEKVIAAGKGVLIHCMAGVSRSPTLAAAQALVYLKKRRPCVDLNAGFRRQLLLWEQQLGV